MSAFIIQYDNGPKINPKIPYTIMPVNMTISIVKGAMPSRSPIHFDSMISLKKYVLTYTDIITAPA